MSVAQVHNEHVVFAFLPKEKEQIDEPKLHNGINWKMNNNEIKVSNLLPPAKVASKSIEVL